jgi:hypothetical protein
MFEINLYFHGMPMCTLCGAVRFFFGRRQVSVKYNRSGLWINPDHLLFGVMEICMGPSTAMMVIAVLGALLCSVSVPCVWAQNSTGF